MDDKKCCENCHYGSVSEFLEKRGDTCCVICLLRTNPLKGRLYIRSKDDKCYKWKEGQEGDNV